MDVFNNMLYQSYKRNKTAELHIRLNIEEKRYITQCARDLGLTISEYIRQELVSK